VRVTSAAYNPCAVVGMNQIDMFAIVFVATPKTITPLFAGLQSPVLHTSELFGRGTNFYILVFIGNCSYLVLEFIAT